MRGVQHPAIAGLVLAVGHAERRICTPLCPDGDIVEHRRLLRNRGGADTPAPLALSGVDFALRDHGLLATPDGLANASRTGEGQVLRLETVSVRRNVLCDMIYSINSSIIALRTL